MSDRQSSLGEFDDGDDVDEQSAALDNHGDTLAREVERNAADIEHLIDLVDSVTEQMSTLAESVGESDAGSAVEYTDPGQQPEHTMRGYQ